MPREHGRHPLLDHPADLRLRKMPAQGREHRQGMDDVAEGAGADDQDSQNGTYPRPGLYGYGRLFTLAIRSLVAWSLGSPTRAVRPP